MKITKVPKRLAEPMLEVRQLVKRVTEASDDELPNILGGISEWCWPRGDLHYYINILNRFDSILEETCRDYDLHKLQINEFTPLRKRIILAILKYTRLLIENCTSRKLYASYEHLNNLLFTRDIDVLESTLRLMLRFSQQNSIQHPKGELLPSQEKLSILAVSWAPRDHGLDMVDVAKKDAVIPPELLSVKFQFYRRRDVEKGFAFANLPNGTEEGQDEGPSGSVSTPLRPRPRDRVASTGVNLSGSGAAAAATTTTSIVNNQAAHNTEGLTTVELGRPSEMGNNAMDVLADVIEKYGVPAEDHFELYQKIRLAMAMPDLILRRQLLLCRLLAIGCYAHIVPESSASTQLFLFEPEIVSKLAGLVNPQNEMLPSIVSGSLYALDALGRYRSRLNEVLNSLNASVNHGILLQILRNITDDVSSGSPTSCDEYVDAYFGLVSFVTSTNLGSGLVVGAGLLHLLIKLVDSAKPESYMIQRSITRAIGLLDSIIYAYMPAFNLFCQANGLDIFVRRIEEELNNDIEAANSNMEEGEDPGPDHLFGKLTFGRAHLLRGFLQSISHMMVSTGTADGLRNLIDSSLLASIQKIMENRRVIGPQNLALAIGIMATFVHNEPTSLGIIQEKKLPETFLALVKEDIEAEFDVMNAIPNAIGALCLNQAGLDMFNSDTTIDKLLSLLTSQRHNKILQDQDNISIFGSSIDELVRHQPTMKQKVQDGIFKVLDTIQLAGKAYESPETERVSMYRLSKVESRTNDGLVEETSIDSASATHQSMALADVIMDEADVFSRKDDSLKEPNNVASYMDVTARFLEALFQSSNHCKDFLRADGLEKLLNFYNLPCLSFNFASTVTADSMVHLLRFISEVNPNTVITALLREVKTSLEETKPMWSQTDQVSSLSKLLRPPTEQDLTNSNEKFRQLIKLNARMQLLSDVAPTFTYSGSKTPTTLLQVLNITPSIMAGNRDVATINDLGDFQRAWIWETVLFKASTHSVAKAIKVQTKDKEATIDDQVTSFENPLFALEESKAKERSDQEEAGESSQQQVYDPNDPLVKNTLALRYIASQVKIALGNFFVETNRLLSTRRAHDSSHKRFASLTASSFGQILYKNMIWKPHTTTSLSYDYLMVMMTQVGKLLYEDRPTQATHAQTIVLVPFIKKGGLNEILENYKRFSNELERQYDAEGAVIKESTGINDALHACGGLQMTLDLLLKMVNHGPLLESPSTQTMKSKEGVSRDSPEYFEPKAFLVNLRLTIIPVVRETWMKKWLISVNLMVARNVLRIILKIAEGQGETTTIPASSSERASGATGSLSTAVPSSTLAGLARAFGGAAPLGGFTNSSGIRSRTAPVADEARITQLTDMGFPRRAARHALIRCSNNLSAATEYLLMHPEVVNSMQGGDAQAGEGEPVTTGGNPEETAAAAASDEQAAPELTSSTIDSALESSLGGASAGESSEGNEQSEEASSTNPLNSDTLMGESADSGENDGVVETAKEAKKEEAVVPDIYKEELESLTKQREEILTTLLSRSLELSDKFESLVFDVRSVVRVVTKSYTDIEELKDLFQTIQEAAPQSLGEKMHFVTVRLHLLALIFNDHTYSLKCGVTRAKQLLQSLVSLIETPEKEGHEATWMASLLLVLSALLRAEDLISETKMIDKEDRSEHEMPRIAATDSIFADELPKLLDYSLQRLGHASKLPRDDLLALYRFLVIVTRRPGQAKVFLEKDGLEKLMTPFASIGLKDVAGCRPYAVLIMRHLVESNAEILHTTMTQEVRSFFSQSRVKVIDTSSSTKSLGSVILRDPDVFLDVMKSNIELVDYKPAQNQGILKLPEAKQSENQLQESSSGLGTTSNQEVIRSSSFMAPLERGPDESMELVPPSPTKQGSLTDEQMLEVGVKGKESGSTSIVTSPASLDSVIHFLLSELFKTSRERSNKKAEFVSATAKEGKETKKEGDEDGTDSSYFYICFLLQSLTELLSSYRACKTSFLSFIKKRNQTLFTSSSATASGKKEPVKAKQSGSALNFFLFELVPIGFIQSREHEEMRRLMSISNWAMSTLVALCADVVALTSDFKEANSEVVFARKSVLDGIAKSIKEATTQNPTGRANEGIESRYGRLYSLSDLCYRLLKARPNATSVGSSFTRPNDDLTLHMAKTMLERNFVTVLTSALAEVDLNLPMVKSLLDRILKPLEYLTKVAIKMNKAERKNDKRSKFETEDFDMNDLESVDEDEMDEEDEDMEEEGGEEEAREETPDFYRNSSLGMLTGDLDNQVNFDEDEDDDDEDDDMDEDMEGVVYNEDDTDDSSDDDDIDEEHIVEVIEEDDDDSDEELDTDNSDEEHDGGEDVEGTGSWVDEDDDDEDEESEELDFIIDGDPEEAQRIFQQAGQLFHPGGEEDEEDDEEGVVIDGGPDTYGDGDEDEDDEEGIEEEDDESVLEGIFEQGDLTTMPPPYPFHDNAPMDRFGATWNWTNNSAPTSNRGTTTRNQDGQTNEVISPFAFLRQRPVPDRRARRWDPSHVLSELSGQPYNGGSGRFDSRANDDIASHPLLTQSSSQADLQRSSPSRRRLVDGSGRRIGQSMQPYEDFAQSLEGMMEGGAMQFLETLLSRNGAGQGNGGPGEAIHISMTGGGGGMTRMSIGGMPAMPRPRDLRHFASTHGRLNNASSGVEANGPIDPVASVQDFSPIPTLARWGEGMRIIVGAQIDERLRMMRAHIVNTLRPSYLIKQEEVRKMKEQFEEERKKIKELREKEAAEKAAEESAKKAEQEKIDQDLAEARARLNNIGGESSETIQTNEQTTASVDQSQAGGRDVGATVDADVDMAEDGGEQTTTTTTNNEPVSSATSSIPANLELNSLQQGLDELDSSGAQRQVPGSNEASGAANTEATTAAAPTPVRTEPEPPRERVTTTINGNEIDITDSGIDPTFLEALPEDMREEVLNQHFRERRAAEAAAALSASGGGSGSRLESSNIAPEFLEALPPDLRAEVIQQEAVENQRRRREERRAEGGGGGGESSRGPSDIDTASFLATLNPDLRGAVLMDQDPSFLNSMPADIRREVEEMQRASRQLGETRRRLQAQRNGGLPATTGSSSTRIDGQSGSGEGGQDPNKKATPRDAIQLLDKAGIAALVRLLFFPQMNSSQSGLRDVLVNLSENSKSRSELLNLLLMILAEGTSADSNAVDKSYSNMSVRVNKFSLQTPTRPAPKRNNTTSTPGTAVNLSTSSIQQGSTQQQLMLSSQPPATPTSFIAPLSTVGDEAPFLIASRSIETLLYLTSANEQAAHYFLKDDPSNIGLMKWFKKSSNLKGKEKEKGTSNAPINILLVLLGKPSILANAQLVDSLIALLNTVTRPLPTITANRRKAEEEREKAKQKPAAITADKEGESTEEGAVKASTMEEEKEGDEEKEEEGKDVVTSNGKEEAPVELPMPAPHISEERMASVVKPLSISISSKGFQNTLAVASNLSTMDGAREVITSALQREANLASKSLIGELDDLLASLPAPVSGKGKEEEEGEEEGEEENEKEIEGKREEAGAMQEQRFSSPALTKLASPSSSQTVILRSLRALEWVMTRPKMTAAAAAAASTSSSTTNPTQTLATGNGTHDHHHHHHQHQHHQNHSHTLGTMF